MKEQKTVAVIGSGAVGGYYGARLAQAGHDVTFLARRDYRAIKAGGLHVTSPEGDFTLSHSKVARDSKDIGPVDWIICALKSTSIAQAPSLVEPCVGPKTRILVLMNGLGLEDRFAAWFGGERIFGGLAFTCINRGKPGFVHHLAYGTITIGHYCDDPVELENARSIWSGSKVQTAVAESLLRARWEKLCWNIPFSGLCVAAGGITTDVVLNDAALSEAARVLMNEVVAAGNADLAYHSERVRIDGPSIADRMFRNTGTMGAYRPSTMIDFVDGRAMEIESIFETPLRRALSLGSPAPQLELLTALLLALNKGRK
jgi:2-dehydropantoate 2-reductase